MDSIHKRKKTSRLNQSSNEKKGISCDGRGIEDR